MNDFCENGEKNGPSVISVKELLWWISKSVTKVAKYEQYFNEPKKFLKRESD